MIWVTYIVDSVMKSQYWKNSLIIITWDDYGGFYDHVPPPMIDLYGFGFRVPALIISPYSKTNYVDHTLYSFESILKFIEWRFSLPSLTLRDASANNILNALNFSSRPRQPISINLTAYQIKSIMPYVGNVANFNQSYESSTLIYSILIFLLILIFLVILIAIFYLRKRIRYFSNHT